MKEQIDMLFELLQEVAISGLGIGLDSVSKASSTQLIVKWNDGRKALVMVKPIEV